MIDFKEMIHLAAERHKVNLVELLRKKEQRSKPSLLLISWGFLIDAWKTSVRKQLENTFDVHEIHRCGRNKGDWRKEISEYLNTHKPQYSLTLQRWFGAATTVKSDLDRVGVRQMFVDYAPSVIEHSSSMIVDPAGENASASTVGKLDAALNNPAERKYILDSVLAVTEMERKLRANAKACTNFPKNVPANFVLICTQKEKDRVLQLDAEPRRRSTKRLITDCINEGKKQGKYVVIKLHPGDLANLPAIPLITDSYTIIAAGTDNNLLAWCLVNCSHLVAINSTVLYQGLALGKPVAMLGRGWCSDNNVAVFCSTIRQAIANQPMPNTKRQAWMCAWLTSRTVSISKVTGEALLGLADRFWPEAPVQDWQGNITSLTAVYAPTKDFEAVTLRTLAAVKEQLPLARKMVGVDVATEAFRKDIRALGFEVFEPKPCCGQSKEPPRLNQIMKEAVKRCKTDFLVTVEADVVPCRGTIKRLYDGIVADERLAVCEGNYRNAEGKEVEPSRRRQLREKLKGNVRRVVKVSTFSCSVWRKKALVPIDWKHLPKLHTLDIRLSKKLLDSKWLLGCISDAFSLHTPHTFSSLFDRHNNKLVIAG